MENKHQEIFYNTDHVNTNPSLPPAFLGQQINPATHQASSSDIFDTVPFNSENFDLVEMLSNRDYYHFPTNTSIFDVVGAPSSGVLQPIALQPQPQPFVPAPALGVTSEIVNTPDSSSMNSSSSNETVTQDQISKRIGKDGEEEIKVQDKNKKL